jgi:hypothetical protein
MNREVALTKNGGAEASERQVTNYRLKRHPKSGARDDKLDRRIKFGNFLIAIISALSVIVSGIIGVCTYRQSALKEEAAQQQEQSLRKYNQLRDLYFQLVDAAAAVGTANSRKEAIAKLNEFDRIYFGKAHVFVLDENVRRAKIKFYWNVHELINTEHFPSRKISLLALDLSSSCKDSLASVKWPTTAADGQADPAK